jgi:hypothetical protein
VASRFDVLAQTANAHQAPLPVISMAPSKPTAHTSTGRGPQNCAIWRRVPEDYLSGRRSTGIARHKSLEESQRPRLGHRPEGDDAPCQLMPSCIAGESHDDEVGTSCRLPLTFVHQRPRPRARKGVRAPPADGRRLLQSQRSQNFRQNPKTGDWRRGPDQSKTSNAEYQICRPRDAM